jgi:hypothetical protein
MVMVMMVLMMILSGERACKRDQQQNGGNPFHDQNVARFWLPVLCSRRTASAVQRKA